MNQPISKGLSLEGISDLTLSAPIKPGLVEGLADPVSHLTRLQFLLRTLMAGRVAAREQDPIRPLADPVERVRQLHSFRLALLDLHTPQPRLLLAVTFDAGWEAYLRSVWSELGLMLDAIFCNCVGYPTAFDHSYEAYVAWVHRAQEQTAYFYNSGPTTVDDLLYLRQFERSQRVHQLPAADAAVLRLQTPADQARAMLDDGSSLQLPTNTRLGLRAIAGLYGLTSLYPPDHADGEIFLRAAHDLLRDLHERLRSPDHPLAKAMRGAVQRPGVDRFAPALDWFLRPVPARQTFARPPFEVDPSTPPAPGALQAGIATPHPGIDTGAMVLLALEGPAAGAALLGHLLPALQARPAGERIAPGEQATNLALTLQGLAKLGVPAAALQGLPVEFREGMARRAGVLGDLRHNHPSQWQLPERNWQPPGAPGSPRGRVALEAVHAIVSLWTVGAEPPTEVSDPSHPLNGAVAALSGIPGVRVLSVQAMRRVRDADGNSAGHFGFRDGIGQPQFGTGQAPSIQPWTDDEWWGELLLGHSNRRGDPAHSMALQAMPWLRDGSFLVVRKLRQHVDAWDAVLNGPYRNPRGAPPTQPPLEARLMGRDANGASPLLPPPHAFNTNGEPNNDFNHGGDPDGRQVLLQSHVRLANPRRKSDISDRPLARIVRRGMSYGQTAAAAPLDADRGLVFMAYNASIAEQFEAVQRWLAGSNVNGQSSEHGDPLLAVPPANTTLRHLTWNEGGALRKVVIDRPLVSLQWGLYAFAPALAAVSALAELAQAAAARAAAAASARASARVRAGTSAGTSAHASAPASASAPVPATPDPAAADWLARQIGAPAAPAPSTAGLKQVLEEVGARRSGFAARVWAQIRQAHPSGVLDTPYGLIVAGEAAVEQALAMPELSTAGYNARLSNSFGPIYLGLDDGPQYQAESQAANAAIAAIGVRQAFDAAHAAALDWLDGVAKAGLPQVFELKDFSEQVLAALCPPWFGLPDHEHVHAGGVHWNWMAPSPPRAAGPPRCPGHFMAPSRMSFQPHPPPAATRYGEHHGQDLIGPVTRFIAKRRGAPDLPPILAAILGSTPNNDLAARTLIGAMMGFLPTTDGNLRSTLAIWIEGDELWSLQLAYLDAAAASADAFEAAETALRDPLLRSLQARPVPELVWRTARKNCHIGGVNIAEGRQVVIALVSATQALLARDETDARLVFGGQRQPGGPTHACPGYDMAIGVLLGCMAALCSFGASKATLRPGLSVSSLTLARP